MNCKVCGAPLTGVEVVCPGCGNPVEKEIPVVENQVVPEVAAPVAPAMPEVAAPVVEPVQPAMPEVQPAPVMPEVAAMPVQPEVAVQPVMEQAAPVNMAQPVTPEVPTFQTMPEVQPTPVAPEVPAMPVQPVMNSVEPVVNPMQQPMQVPVAGQAPVQQAPKQNKTVLLIIILIGVVAIAAVSLFALGVFDGDEGDSGSGSGNGSSGGDSGDIVEKQNSTISYSGFTFTVPEGYETEIDTKTGLNIYNDQYAFTIMVDYTNTYEQYKTEYMKKYPQYAADMVMTIGGREYMGLVLEKDGKQFDFYATKDKKTEATFVGLVGNSKFTAPTEVEFKLLNTILDKATSSSSFAAGDDGDAGRDGLVKETYGTSDIKFSTAK